MNTKACKRVIALFVLLRIVLVTIYLDTQQGLVAIEIKRVRAEWELPPKLESKSIRTNLLPNPLLRA